MGTVPINPVIVDEYTRAGRWGDRTLSDVVSDHASKASIEPAYVVVGTDTDHVSYGLSTISTPVSPPVYW